MVAETDTEPLPLDGDPPPSGQFAGGIDYAALWRQLDADSARVVVLDLDQRAVLAGRTLGDANQGGSTGRFGSDVTPERLFPGATALIERWRSEVPGPNSDLATHGLSPRQWVYFWRVDAKVGLLVVVHHRYGRSAVGPGDSAFIRVLAEHWLAPELQAMGVGRAATAPWNRVERRARASAPVALWGALLALTLSTACGLWLLMAGGGGAPPRAEEPWAREAQRLAKLSDDTLARSLSLALAGKDYGEAQQALTEHQAMQHFNTAAVLNERQQVVAHVGFAQPLTVGQTLPPGLEPGARRLPLRWAGNSLGELIMVPRPAPIDTGAAPDSAAAPRSGALVRTLGGVLVALGLVSGALLWRHLRMRYR